MNGAPPLSAQIAEAKAASVALFRRDGAALHKMQETSPAFFAQLDRAVRVPILVAPERRSSCGGTPSSVRWR